MSGHEMQRNSNYRYFRCINTIPRSHRPRSCDAKGVRVSVLEPRAWDEVRKIIEDPDTILNELRAQQGSADVLDEEIAKALGALKAI